MICAVSSPEEKALLDYIRRLWLWRWAMLEEEQSLVAEHAMLLARHAHVVERLQRPELIEEHQAWAERHAKMRARLARAMDEFLWGAPRQ
jgi:hypothetical protein